MWRFVALIAMLNIISVASKPVGSFQGQYLFPAEVEVKELARHLRSASNDHMFRQRQPFYRSPYTDINLSSLYPLPNQDKRSLSMLAHWSSLGSFGKQRNPIREFPRWRPADTDGITAETRARAGAQPLRWG